MDSDSDMCCSEGDDGIHSESADDTDETSFDSLETDTVTYKYLQSEEVAGQIDDLLDGLVAVTSMPRKTSSICLRHYNWDKNRLLEHFTEMDSDEFYKQAGVINRKVVATNTRRSRSTECGICSDTFPTIRLQDIGCGHKFCNDCWHQYITMKIADEGVDVITCPEPKCSIKLDGEFIESVITEQSLRAKYQRIIVGSYVASNDLLNWCPSPKCTLVVQASTMPIYDLTCACKCGCLFCFKCSELPHEPIPCAMIRVWKDNDNDSTFEYLAKFVKECPMCHSLIEKNGGCNHMTCRKCGYEFCWLCNKKYSGAHGCNTYESKGDSSSESRTNHYYQRYANHRSSLIAETDKHQQLFRRRLLEDEVMPWEMQDSLKNACDVLSTCRRQLMYSYIFAFYLKMGHQTTIFESNQRDLESAVEGMAGYVERICADATVWDKPQLFDKMKYCDGRQKRMQDHIHEGFTNHWWSFQQINI